MAAGDKSKKLVIDIRDAIGDNDNIHYKNDNQIYQRLNHYQLLFMTKHFTTFKRWEIALSSGVFKYPMDDTILAVIHRPYSNNETDYKADWIHEPYSLDGVKANRTIILQNEADIPSGTKLFVETYVKAKDPISAAHDPEIGDDYNTFLVEAVKSESRDRLQNMGFQTLAQVLKDVRSTKNALNTKKKIKGSQLKNTNF